MLKTTTSLAQFSKDTPISPDEAFKQIWADDDDNDDDDDSDDNNNNNNSDEDEDDKDFVERGAASRETHPAEKFEWLRKEEDGAHDASPLAGDEGEKKGQNSEE